MKTAFYDLRVSPPSHDCLSFLMEAKREGCERTVFVPGSRAIDRPRYNDLDRRIDTLLMPLARCAGMEPVKVKSRQEAKAFWDASCFPDCYAVDYPVPKHSANLSPGAIKARPEVVEQMSRYKGCVTISVRDMAFQPERNSQVEEWMLAAEEIKAMGYRVVFIPDANNPGFDFHNESCPVVDEEYRIALYSVALVNMGIFSGNLASLIVSGVPVIAIPKVLKGHSVASAKMWKHFLGVKVGEQLPWFEPKQRLFWHEDNDTCENIVRAFHEWLD